MTDWVEQHYAEQRTKKKGGPGSGHWGHSGRPGKRGGSLPGKGGGVSLRFGEGSSRPNIIYGSRLTGTVRMDDREQQMVTDALSKFVDKLPPEIGAAGSVPVSIDSRPAGPREREAAITNGTNIYINKFRDRPGAWKDTDTLSEVLAHEFGHVLLKFDSGLQGRVEAIFGKGPYERGTAGVTSTYHLQNARELFSKLYGQYLMGETVDPHARSLMESKE